MIYGATARMVNDAHRVVKIKPQTQGAKWTRVGSFNAVFTLDRNMFSLSIIISRGSFDLSQTKHLMQMSSPC